MIYTKLQIYINFFIVYSAYLTFKSVKANYLEDNYPKSVIEDASLDTVQLITKYKYPVETHYVTTEDKYILGLHRIPKPKSPPVLLLHGLLDSSATWIIMGPDQAPGYYLSDNGYDVWIGNARGNRYSRNHTILNPDIDRKFWKFSWHEIGLYDLSSMIDYILEQTGYKKLAYFGHSQGTTAFFVLCSMRPEYNDKIAITHAISPAVFTRHLRSPILKIGQSISDVFKSYVKGEVLRHSSELYRICFASKSAEETCVGLFHQMQGNDEDQFNATMYPVIFGHLPAGSSFKQLLHYEQTTTSDRFCQYDYGPKQNMKRYGAAKPPEYPLEKITVPIGLYYAYNDYLVGVMDVKKLLKILPNIVEDTLYPYKNWNHLTAVWGIDARELAHKRMLEIMKNYPYK